MFHLKQHSEPIFLKEGVLSDMEEVARLRNLHGVRVVDSFDHQRKELDRLLPKFEGEVSKVWVHYPWSNVLLSIISEKAFRRIRTDRNRDKISSEEQEILGTKRIGIIGMSVGRSVATTMAMERIFGELRIADMDTLDLSNLNRLRAPLHDLGISKTTSLKRELLELDPFLSIQTFDEGITKENMDSFMLEGGKLDLLIEECDNLEVKIRTRIRARELGIPVIMETSDRGMLDVERFDLEPDRPLFHGMLEDFDFEALDFQDPSTGQRLLTSILDFSKVSERGVMSLQKVGKSISTWPQLASAVALGGGVVTDTARRILLGEFENSGRFYIDLHAMIR